MTMTENLWKCNNCGHVFADGEQVNGSEIIGECHGTVAETLTEACPCCGSTDFECADRCDICGKVFLSDDLKGGACPECWKKIVEHYSHKAARMAKLFSEEEADFKLNPFILWALDNDKEKIEKILLSFLIREERRSVLAGEEPISYEDFLDTDEADTVYRVQGAGDIE